MKKWVFFIALLMCSTVHAQPVTNGDFEQEYFCGRAGVRYPLNCNLPKSWQQFTRSNADGTVGKSYGGYLSTYGAYLSMISKSNSLGYVELKQAATAISEPLWLSLLGQHAFAMDTQCTTPLVARIVWRGSPNKGQTILIAPASPGFWLQQATKFTAPAGYSLGYISMYIQNIGHCVVDNVRID